MARLCDPGPEVSAHYVIGEQGQVWRLVDERMRAWHAGLSCWREERDVNSASVGIELANCASLADFPPFAEAQMVALEALLGGVMSRWNIAAQGVLGHSDVAPGRKADPGPKFDWERLAHQGLALPRPEAGEAGGDFAEFCADLGAFGYDGEAGDALLDAFRLRWRPEASGRAFEAEDAALASALRRTVGAN